MIAPALYTSPEWQTIRLRRLRAARESCEACGARRRSGARLLVHHVRPVRTNPELALDYENTIVLCGGCHEAVHWVANRRSLIQLVQLASDPRLVTARRLDFGPVPLQFGLDLEHAANDEAFEPP